MTATAATPPTSTMTQVDTGRALLQLVLDNHGSALGWTIGGVLMTTAGADPVATMLLDAAHLLLYGPPLNNR